MKKLWKDIRESISGTDQDFTKGSLNRAILLLSIPMVLEMMMESLFALFDTLFVAQLGTEALATIAYTEGMMTIFYAIGVGFSMATTALVARRIGENNRRAASIVASQAIIVGILFSLILAIPGIFFPKDLLFLMGASPATIDQGYMFTSLMLSFNIVIMLLFIINAVFRSSGDAAISLRVLFLANLLNIVLDPCLIFGLGPFPELGIKGAAIATIIGRGSAVVFQFYILFKGNVRIQVSLTDFRIRSKTIIKLIKVSYGGIGQYLIATSSWIILVRILSEFGDSAVAGYQIAIRLIVFSLLPSWGLSNAAATMVGQNLGAKKPDRAERSVWKTAFINVVFLMFFAVLFIYDSEFFIRLFVDDIVVIEFGAKALRIISFGYLCYAFGMVMPQAFNGAGDTATPTWINFFSFWMIQIPIAYLLALEFGWEEDGVFVSIVIGETVLAILGIWLFRRGKWKLKKV
ncbi:MAG: MATE family efflux transporter [Cyclobacteriaceae bacterium]|nr:MATE family efflux transporter [Cyclobacteriaceae bacterium]MCK5471293.1 MATE family efflux transporter [Cyclobacteriaceae bacterium]